MKKVLIIGSECKSLMRFRGELLKSFKNINYDVFACAGGKCDQATVWFNEFGINYIPVRISRTGLNPFSDLMFFYQLLNIIRKINPDLILAYTIKPVIYGMLASRICRIKNCYALITGLGYAFIPGNSLKQRIVKINVWVLYKISLKGAKSIFFQNEDDLTLFKNQKIISNSARAIRVYGSGVDLDYYKFKPVPANIRIIHFLLIARLLRDKGIYEYVEAARIIQEKFPNKEIKFSLLGPLDSNPAAITKNEVNEWVNKGLIQYFGESEDVRPYIEKCSVFVLPSYREGMPRSVLEAMSIGRAIITTNVPGCKDTVISGKNGFLVKMKSAKELSLAMTKFIENDYLIQEMGTYSRNYVCEKFNVHKINAVMLKEIGIVS